MLWRQRQDCGCQAGEGGEAREHGGLLGRDTAACDPVRVGTCHMHLSTPRGRTAPEGPCGPQLIAMHQHQLLDVRTAGANPFSQAGRPLGILRAPLSCL